MEKLGAFLQLKEKKQVTVVWWQTLAVEAVHKLVDGNDRAYKGAIFQKFKEDPKCAALALSDALELHKPHARYFFKVYSELRKKYV
jgi:hypothetical protein